MCEKLQLTPSLTKLQIHILSFKRNLIFLLSKESCYCFVNLTYCEVLCCTIEKGSW